MGELGDLSGVGFKEQWPNVERAKDILVNHLTRPEPFEVIGLKDSEIDLAAEAVGYPVFQADHLLAVHEASFPVVSEAVSFLMSRHWHDEPQYFFIGRDADELYDAFVLRAKSEDFEQRVHRINRGMGVDFEKYHSLEFDYLRQQGLRAENLKNGERWVFVDSGYSGTVFDILLYETGFPGEMSQGQPTIFPLVMENITGYLVWKRPRSAYQQVNLVRQPKTNDFAEQVYKQFVPGFEVPEWVEGLDMWPVMDSAQRSLWALCTWMQLQPKYAEKAVTFERRGQEIVALPKKRERQYPRRGIRTIKENNRAPNDSVEDPVVALKLQARTANYFS